MKKLLIVFSMLMVILTVVGCGNKDKDEEKNPEENVTYVKPAEVLEKIKNKESFLFVIGSATCPACQNYRADALKQLNEKEGVKLPYIDVFEIESKEKEFKDIKALIKDHLDNQFDATPTTYLIKKGDLTKVTVGSMNYKEVEKLYKEVKKEESKK